MVGRVSSLRTRLRHGPALVGTFMKLPGTDALRTVAGAGFDLVIVDLEHSQLSEGQARELVAAADMLGIPSSVRIPEHDRGTVNRLLEAGADAIQLSSVRSAAQVEALVSDTRYAPGGGRSISLAHAAAGYGRHRLAEHLGRLAANPALLNNFTDFFLATGGRQVAQQQLDYNEEIEIVLLSTGELLDLLRRQQIKQSLHASCIFYGLMKLGLLNLNV